jgi:hypothetical protein
VSWRRQALVDILGSPSDEYNPGLTAKCGNYYFEQKPGQLAKALLEEYRTNPNRENISCSSLKVYSAIAKNLHSNNPQPFRSSNVFEMLLNKCTRSLFKRNTTFNSNVKPELVEEYLNLVKSTVRNIKTEKLPGRAEIIFCVTSPQENFQNELLRVSLFAFKKLESLSNVFVIISNLTLYNHICRHVTPAVNTLTAGLNIVRNDDTNGVHNVTLSQLFEFAASEIVLCQFIYGNCLFRRKIKGHCYKLIKDINFNRSKFSDVRDRFGTYLPYLYQGNIFVDNSNLLRYNCPAPIQSTVLFKNLVINKWFSVEDVRNYVQHGDVIKTAKSVVHLILYTALKYRGHSLGNFVMDYAVKMSR